MPIRLIWLMMLSVFTFGQSQDTTVVDVMFFYTPQSKKEAGGTSAIKAIIRDAVVGANEVFRISGTQTLLNLVHSQEVEGYKEASPLGLNHSRIKEKNDGYMDEAYLARQLNGADMASLLVSRVQKNVAGLANVLSPENFLNKKTDGVIFNLLTLDFILGVGNTSHEYGHLMGCTHVLKSNSAKTYGHSHTFTASDGKQYSTNMALPPRIFQFSNPNVNYKGTPTGSVQNNAAKAIREASPIFSNIYTSRGEVLVEVSLSSPKFGEEYNSTENITLGVDVTKGDVKEVVYYANDVEIARASTFPYGTVWNNPKAGNYNIHAKTTSVKGAVMYTFSHPIAVKGVGVLPAPFISHNIYKEQASGTTVLNNGVYRTTGSSGLSKNEYEDFHFVYVPLAGNGKVTIQLMSVDGNSWQSRAGVMIRANLHSSSAHVFLAGLDNRGKDPMLSHYSRDKHWGKRQSQSLSPVGANPYLRLERVGDKVSSYYSSDGVSYTLFKSSTVYLTDTAYYGMAFIPEGSGFTATTRNLSVKQEVVSIQLKRSRLQIIKGSGYYNLLGQKAIYGKIPQGYGPLINRKTRKLVIE